MNQRDTRIWNTPAVQAEPHGSQRAMKTAVELREKLESAQARLRAIDEERAGRAFDGMLENGASPNRRSLEKLRADGAAVAGRSGILRARSPPRSKDSRMPAAAPGGARPKTTRGTSLNWPSLSALPASDVPTLLGASRFATPSFGTS